MGSLNSNMSLCYEDTLHGHLAEYMIYLSTAQSFWFSLNLSYDHDFDLSQRFGMMAHSYECLLVAANLAVFHKSWGFTINILQWKKFLEGHHFITSNSIGSFEVDTKKIDLHAFINGTKPTKDRVKIHMIRIGILHHNSPRKIEMQKYSDG